MKWPADQTEIMRSAFAQFITNSELSPSEIRDSYPDEKRRLWAVYRSVVYDLQNDDSHPAYTAGKWDDGSDRTARVRRVDRNSAFLLYPPGCNDDHLWTMLKHIAKSTGIA